MNPGRVLAPLLLAASSAVSAAAAWTVAVDDEFLGRHLSAARPIAVAAFAALALFALAVLAQRIRRGGPWRVAPSHARLLFVTLIASLAIQAIYVDHSHASLTPVLAACVLATFPLASTAGVALARRVPSKWLRALDFTAWTAATSLVLFEAALRLLASIAPSPLFETVDLDTKSRTRIFALAPGRVHHGFAANSRGHYDTELVRKSDGDPRALVVCLGDSFSLGIVPHALHYTTVCEQAMPGVEVYNFGIATAGPFDYLHWIENDVQWLRPDLVVVSLFLGNDVTDTSRHGESDPDPWRPHWTRLLAFLVPRRLLTLSRETSIPRIAPDDPNGPPGTEVTPLDELKRRSPWIERPELEPPSNSRDAFLEIETVRARMICESRSPAFEPFFDVMERIGKAARGVPLAVMLIPDEFQVEDELWHTVVARVPDARLDRDLAQQRIARWLDERKIPYVDLLPALRAVAPMEDGRRHVYKLQDTHFNARGNRVAGLALADLVKRTRATR